jgi:hypothetical protein
MTVAVGFKPAVRRAQGRASNSSHFGCGARAVPCPQRLGSARLEFPRILAGTTRCARGTGSGPLFKMRTAAARRVSDA